MPLLPRLLSLFRRKAYSSVPTTSSGGWYPIIREPFTGAWQRNIHLDARTASSFHADFACKTLIARDISKLAVRLVQQVNRSGIWEPVENAAYSPVLRKPNHYQTRNQFWESWILSKLCRGNTYVLKERDARGVVTALYVLNPDRVQVLEADDGSVFYRLSTDSLSSVNNDIVVPAREIIHDRFNCLFHHLVGIPPIYASCLAAMQGLNIQNYSASLFANASQPGGILTAPGNITKIQADQLRDEWEKAQAGRNVGKIAILGNGLEYKSMALTAVEGQLIEQLKWSAEVVCSTYHVPPYKIGVGDMPSYNNVQALNVEYYAQCLQSLIEDAESCLDEGLGLSDKPDLGIEFDLDNLLRMDSVTQADFVTRLVKGGVMTPNNGRRKFNLENLEGGDTVFMQQQDIPMSVAASITEHPLKPQPAPVPPVEPDEPEMNEETARGVALWEYRKAVAALAAA